MFNSQRMNLRHQERNRGWCHLSREGPGWGERELSAQGTGAPTEGSCTGH